MILILPALAWSVILAVVAIAADLMFLLQGACMAIMLPGMVMTLRFAVSLGVAARARQGGYASPVLAGRAAMQGRHVAQDNRSIREEQPC